MRYDFAPFPDELANAPVRLGEVQEPVDPGMLALAAVQTAEHIAATADYYSLYRGYGLVANLALHVQSLDEVEYAIQPADLRSAVEDVAALCGMYHETDYGDEAIRSAYTHRGMRTDRTLCYFLCKTMAGTLSGWNTASLLHGAGVDLLTSKELAVRDAQIRRIIRGAGSAFARVALDAPTKSDRAFLIQLYRQNIQQSW